MKEVIFALHNLGEALEKTEKKDYNLAFEMIENFVKIMQKRSKLEQEIKCTQQYIN